MAELVRPRPPEIEKACMVLWSGGCDSTLVLWDLLRRKNTGPVRALSIAHHQVWGNKEQRKARASIRKWMKARGYTFTMTEVAIYPNKKLYDFGACSGDGGSMQPLIWLPTALTYLLEDEDLHIGYIRGDDFWHHREDLVITFHALQRVAGKKGDLYLPLEWSCKAGVITRLRKTRGLLSRIWYCENPKKGKPCRKCSPCKTHRSAMLELKHGIRNY